jgi:glycine C-acetyltransferase
MVEQTGGGILVITEGVFGMSGAQGKLKEIIA